MTIVAIAMFIEKRTPTFNGPYSMLNGLPIGWLEN
jgi:hypothetical protein